MNNTQGSTLLHLFKFVSFVSVMINKIIMSIAISIKIIESYMFVIAVFSSHIPSMSEVPTH